MRRAGMGSEKSSGCLRGGQGGDAGDRSVPIAHARSCARELHVPPRAISDWETVGDELTGPDKPCILMHAPSHRGDSTGVA